MPLFSHFDAQVVEAAQYLVAAVDWATTATTTASTTATTSGATSASTTATTSATRAQEGDEERKTFRNTCAALAKLAKLLTGSAAQRMRGPHSLNYHSSVCVPRLLSVSTNRFTQIAGHKLCVCVDILCVSRHLDAFWCCRALLCDASCAMLSCAMLFLCDASAHLPPPHSMHHPASRVQWSTFLAHLSSAHSSCICVTLSQGNDTMIELHTMSCTLLRCSS